MAKRLILAVAGAGKTRTICRQLNPGTKNLLLAFTHENIKNFHRELEGAFGGCPELTDVMTFHSFVHRFVVRPYMPSILAHFPDAKRPQGMTMRTSPPKILKTKTGRCIPNPNYATKDTWEHYVDRENRLYCDTLCELVTVVKKGKRRLLDRIVAGINRCYDHVAIDEFQDFREYEFELLEGLARGLDDVVLVGDYYQHSVAARNNSGKPFAGRAKSVSYAEFVNDMEKKGFSVDTTSLSASYRCSSEICEFVSRKLDISIKSSGVSNGRVRLVPDKEIEDVLHNPDIVKLVDKESDKKDCSPCLNWSYSKGDTYEHVCVILTGKCSGIVDDNFSFDCSEIKPATRNKLYVALTRTKGDLLLVTKKQFDRWKSPSTKMAPEQLELELFRL